MRAGKKVLIMAGCAALMAASAGAIGTIAYFSDSDSAANTFTVGSVEIFMDELDVDNDRDLSDITPAVNSENMQRDKANTYHLLPGGEYVKDPIVHIEAGSADCYVFVTVDNQIKEIEKNDEEKGYQTVASQMEKLGWAELKDETGADVKYDRTGSPEDLDVYVYAGSPAKEGGCVIPKSENQTDIRVFTEFEIDGESVINGKAGNTPAPAGKYYIEDFAGKQIVVNAYAVQADGFDTAYAAWHAAAFDN